MNYSGVAMFSKVSPPSAPPQMTQLGDSWRAKYPEFPGSKPANMDRQFALALQTANKKCYPLGDEKCFAPEARLPYSQRAAMDLKTAR